MRSEVPSDSPGLMMKGVVRMPRISKDEYYLGIALAVSKRSTCLKRHYGCVIVNDDIIVATGYNGNPRGEENCCDTGICKREKAARYSGYENCNAVHAEQNAIIAAQRKNIMGGTAYLACEEVVKVEVPEKAFKGGKAFMDTYVEDENPVPCNICLNMLKNAGISRIVNKKGTIYKRVGEVSYVVDADTKL